MHGRKCELSTRMHRSTWCTHRAYSGSGSQQCRHSDAVLLLQPVGLFPQNCLLPHSSPCSTICSFICKIGPRTLRGSMPPKFQEFIAFLLAEWQVQPFLLNLAKNPSPMQSKRHPTQYECYLASEGDPHRNYISFGKRVNGHYRKGLARTQTAGSGPLPSFQMFAKLTSEAWTWDTQKARMKQNAAA